MYPFISFIISSKYGQGHIPHNSFYPPLRAVREWRIENGECRVLKTARSLPVIFHYPFIIFNSREARIARPSIRENSLLSGAIRG
jgi:hypothetical protein